MQTRTYETLIECHVEQLYAFHADPDNLPSITPPGIKVQIIQMPRNITEGSRAELSIRRGLLGFRWTLRFEKIEPPHCIVDVALRSPFAAFRHEHRFEAMGASRALLRDTVTFVLPLGWLGKLFEPLIVRDMNTMFAYRHARTKAMLERPPQA